MASESPERRRPRLAYAFTILTSPGTVRLVAGEDYRYTLAGPELDAWLPAFLERLRGDSPISDLLATLPAEKREAAAKIVERLYGERVLIDGSAADAHQARRIRVHVEGDGPLPHELAQELPTLIGASDLVVFCQDRLDYEDTRRRSRACRAANTALLWVSHGPMSRAYVSPLFLPNAGPCFGCLLRAFRRLSPAPEIYDALREHREQDRSIRPVDFPPEGLLILKGLVHWKLREAERSDPDPALYRLHVLECASFEVSTHRVFIDVECPDCGRGPS
jgi:bacteriocin biosynthesis cyclodehydratase domain-containing protein